MAACRNCGKAVGCGCNLNKSGLCATCAVKAKTEPIQPSPTLFVPIEKAIIKK